MQELYPRNAWGLACLSSLFAKLERVSQGLPLRNIVAPIKFPRQFCRPATIFTRVFGGNQRILSWKKILSMRKFCWVDDIFKEVGHPAWTVAPLHWRMDPLQKESPKATLTAGKFCQPENVGAATIFPNKLDTLAGWTPTGWRDPTQKESSNAGDWESKYYKTGKMCTKMMHGLGRSFPR